MGVLDVRVAVQVDAERTRDGVVAATDRLLNDVVAGPGNVQIVTSAADKQVIAIAADQGVVAVATVEEVVVVARSEERREGNGGIRTCRPRVLPDNKKKKKTK